MTRHCSCAAQLQPHDWIMGVCPRRVNILPPVVNERVAVEFPIGHDWRPPLGLLVDPDLEDERGRR